MEWVLVLCFGFLFCEMGVFVFEGLNGMRWVEEVEGGCQVRGGERLTSWRRLDLCWWRR